MTKGIPYSKSREQIQCEQIDRQIQELRDIQNSLVPNYNPVFSPESIKPKSHWYLLTIPALTIIALFTHSMDIIYYVIATGLFALPIAFISIILASFLSDIHCSFLSNLAFMAFTLAAFFIKFALLALAALFLTALIHT